MIEIDRRELDCSSRSRSITIIEKLAGRCVEDDEVIPIDRLSTTVGTEPTRREPAFSSKGREHRIIETNLVIDSRKITDSVDVGSIRPNQRIENEICPSSEHLAQLAA